MTDYSELKRLAEHAAEQRKKWEEAGRPWPIWNSFMYEMHSALTPDVMLAVIAEVDALKDEVEQLHRKIGGSATRPDKGHGHVFHRNDRVRMRCGGPGMCKECSADLLRKDSTP